MKSIESSIAAAGVGPFVPTAPFKARVDVGRQRADAGALGESEIAFHRLLDEVRGEHVGNETYVLASLMTIYARGGRAFEALVLARLLANRLLVGGDLRRSAGCLACYCETLAGLRAHGQLVAAIAELETLLARVPDDQAVMARECLHRSAARLAVVAGDLDAAKQHAAAYLALEPEDEQRPWRKSYMNWMIDVDIALADGDPGRALETLERVRGLDIPERGVALSIGNSRVLCFEALEFEAQALEEARELLARLEGLQLEPFLAPERVRVGAWLGGWFARREDCAREAQKAYDFATAAVILRVAQLDSAIRSLPELGLGSIVETSDLVEIRRAFVREQGELLRRVGNFVRSRRGALPFVVRGRDGDFVQICAWCERVCSEGAWLPVGHFVPRDTALKITHSICPACAAGMTA